MPEPLLALRGVSQHFAAPGGGLAALEAVDLEVARGELCCLRGPSGSGKSTLLLALGGMRRPSTGTVTFDGDDLYGLAAPARRALRGKRIGFVFQSMHLLPYLDAAANVALGLDGPDARGRAEALLAGLGLGDRLRHRPEQLSAGERQRVAVARALAPAPDVVLADEPTGSLDPRAAEGVLGELARFHANGGTIVLVTHAERLALAPTRELELTGGRLVGSAGGPA